MGCTRKIRRIGNSFGIIIPKPILEEHNLRIGDFLELSSDENILTFLKVDGKDDKKRRRENK